MKKKKRFLLSPATTVIMFILAAGLLTYSGVGTARAALQYFSNDYSSRMRMDNIGVSLLENGTIVSHRDYISERTKDENGEEALSGYWSEEVPGKLLKDLEKEKIILKKVYPEELRVQNTGRNNVSLSEEDNSAAINEYVRVTIRKYWRNAKEKETYWSKERENEAVEKNTELDPKFISLKLGKADLYDPSVTAYGNWTKDKAATTKERVVLYYNSLLPAGAKSTPFADSISIDGLTAKKVTQTEGNKIITTYDYDGKMFCLEVTVDAVQEHNAQEAITSAWGRNVTVDERAGKLTVAN